MKRHEIRTLLHFFGAIGMIVVMELSMAPLIQEILLPMLWKSYGISAPETGHLRHLQMAAMEGGGIFLMLILVLSWLTPGVAKNVVISLGKQLQKSLGAVIPGLQIDLWGRSVNNRQTGGIFLISLLLLVLQLLPYILAGIYFVFYVVKEGRRIRAEQDALQDALDRERNLMLSDIAHDIRNPITTISGYAQALDDGMVRDPEKQSLYLRTIRKKADRVEQLISLLFDYAKLNSDGFSLQKSSFDFNEFLRQTAAQVYDDAEGAGMELIPEIPNQPYPLTADRLQCSRVIGNLVTNAIRYNPKGTKILIRFTVDPSGWEDHLLTIADSGNEIDPSAAERLFEPFSRGDTSRPTDGGSGLGLSIVKSIVELHGWSISYQTDLAGYTKGFVIRIPRD